MGIYKTMTALYFAESAPVAKARAVRPKVVGHPHPHPPDRNPKQKKLRKTETTKSSSHRQAFVKHILRGARNVPYGICYKGTGNSGYKVQILEWTKSFFCLGQSIFGVRSL